jgi:hypothetical protein
MVDYDLADVAPIWRPQPLGLVGALLVSSFLWVGIIAAARQLAALA